MIAENNILNIAYVNTCGQTKLNESKQLQIEAFAKYKSIDILHLQETEVCDETFKNCNFLSSNYNVITNNSNTGYGTSTLIKSELNEENLRLDTEGRVIVFDVGGVTLANVYLPSGTDSKSRNLREQYCAETLPQLLLNRHPEGIIGGDWNAIIDKNDATKHQESKMSPSLLRLASQTGLTALSPSIQLQDHSQGIMLTVGVKEQQGLIELITLAISASSQLNTYHLPFLITLLL